MSKPIRVVESTVRPIRVMEPTVRRIDPAEVAAALGAELMGDRVPAADPVTLYALRSELFRRRQSQGTLPGIAGTNQRDEIPVSDQDWARNETKPDGWRTNKNNGPTRVTGPGRVGERRATSLCGVETPRPPRLGPG